MSGGRLIAIVGPSGAGKDRVLDEVAQAVPHITPVRRVITRAPDLPGEASIPVSPQDFAEMRANGAFCLHWCAHGLSYGIPVQVLADVQGGAQRIVNLSRGVLSEAQALFPDLLVLHVTARPETLARRLMARHRETEAEIDGRMSRVTPDLPAGIQCLDLPNDGPIEDTVARALRMIGETGAPSARRPAVAGEAPMRLANARLALSDRVVTGEIVLEGGRIAEITERDGVPPGAIDCDGDLILPGLVELHTDNLERHIEPRPGVMFPPISALLAHDGELASTGITTVFDAMRVGSIRSGTANDAGYARDLATELMRLRSRGVLKISHFLHLRAEICSETLLEELAEFGPEDRVGILSLMDHTPGQRQFRDLDKLRTYWSGKRGLRDAEFDAHVEHLTRLRARYGAAHADAAVTEARRFGAVLASHDDTTEHHVRASHDSGAGLAEFPTTIEAAEACRAHGIAIMMGAPNILRGASHSGNVSAIDLAQRDLLDIVSSDYVPSALLLSGFRLAELWSDLPRAIRTVTDSPARAAGLRDRGRLEAGLRADLLRVRCLEATPVIRGVWSVGRRVA
jgi:alpha-D-ribose 1-methylphosphonate 5-triphosphate diphosphatase